MRLSPVIVLIAVCSAGAVVQGRNAPAQTSKPATQAKPTATAKPPATAPRTEPAILNCPSVLGDGVKTARTYCDVQIGDDPAQGIIVTLPPHRGDVTLTFDLHNRHVYSAEQIKAKKAFSRYTATIGVMTPNNHLISRAVVLNEFRTDADLVDRISGGGGAGGLKAVAPTGLEPIAIIIPEANDSVSILGEKLSVVRIDATDSFTTVGRPIAVISNVQVTYTPAPAAKPPASRGTASSPAQRK